MAVGSIAIGAGSEVVGAIGARNENRKQRAANEAAALAAFRSTVADIEARRVEESRAARREAEVATQVSLQERGAAQLTAAEAGVQGASPGAVQAQLARSLADYLITNDANLQATNRQLDRQIAGAGAGAQNQINSIPKYDINPFTVGLRIGSIGLQNLKGLV